MHVIIRNPVRLIFEGFAKEAILPGEDGELSVWDFHHALITTLAKGYITLKSGKNLPAKEVEINSGVATLERNELMILCL
ncbi:MAG: hypothetical protein ABH914_00790 [Candidatus Omnitrophota bacterium]